MSAAFLLNQLLLSILLGGAYALFAVGLSLSAGVLRLVNLAHGDFIVLLSYVILAMAALLGVGAVPAFVVSLPMAFVAGLLLQRFVLQRVSSVLLPRLLVTFGLSVIIQNGLLLWFGADPRQISLGGLETMSLPVIADVQIGVLPLVMFVVAVTVIVVLELLLFHTHVGVRIRAISENLESAELVGLPTQRVLGIAFGIVGVTVAVAAFFMGAWTNFDPSFGPLYLLTAFEVAVLGGLGSLWGMLPGGVIIALAQNIGGQIDASWQALAGHLAFMVIFLLRPNGLFPRQ